MVLLTSEGKMKHENDRQIIVVSAVMQLQYQYCGEEETEPKGEAPDYWSIYLHTLTCGQDQVWFGWVYPKDQGEKLGHHWDRVRSSVSWEEPAEVVRASP